MKIKINLLNATLEASDVKGKQVNQVITSFFEAIDKKDNVSIILQPNFDTKNDKSETFEKQKTETVNLIESPAKIENKNIKLTEKGEKTYRVDYSCPVCEKKSKRFVVQNSTYVKCHNCETKIRIRSAVPGNLNRKNTPKMDENGAYFIATELLQSR